MADFRRALEKTLRWEGGLVNDKDDPGGLTNKGITLETYGQYYDDGAEGLEHIGTKQVEHIYINGYWNRMRGDDFPCQKLAELVFDTCVNCGTRTAVRMLQRLLYVTDDGIVGMKTLEAVEKCCDNELLFDRYKAERLRYYGRLVEKNPRLSKFLRGWTNRVNSFKWQ